MTEMSKEYATALFMLAKEKDCTAEYADALESAAIIFRENAEYIYFLASPSIPKKERIEALDKAFSGNTPEDVVSFIKLLTENGHIREFDRCVSEYKKLYDTSKLIATARVVSAVELTSSEKEHLTQKLEKISGNSVVLDCSVDESLIGGMIIEMDGKVLDGSLRRSLSDVKEVIGR